MPAHRLAHAARTRPNAPIALPAPFSRGIACLRGATQERTLYTIAWTPWFGPVPAPGRLGTRFPTPCLLGRMVYGVSADVARAVSPCACSMAAQIVATTCSTVLPRSPKAMRCVTEAARVRTSSGASLRNGSYPVVTASVLPASRYPR